MAGKVVKKLHLHLLNMPKMRNVVPGLDNNRMKLVLLSTKVCSPETLQPLHKQLTSILHARSFSIVPYRLQMDGNEGVNDIETHTMSRRSEMHRLSSGDVTFLPVENSNVQQLQDMNEKLFPVEYNNAFYKYVVDAPEGYCELACTANEAVIGAICCELEDVKILGKRRSRLCILTLGVLEEHRRSKLGELSYKLTDLNGTLLLESVISQARKDRLAYVYLRVQSCNTAALHFYFAHGFKFVKFMHNYYSEMKSPHCFILRMQLDATT